MKIESGLPLSLAGLFLVCLLPQSSRAQETKVNKVDPPAVSSHTGNSSQTAEAVNTAKQMVPAEAELTKTVDARKDQPGTAFEARLRGTVHLKDGTTLPHGTLLVGQVATDQMRNNGVSQLALRFTEAKLKDGKTIPIVATIVGITGPPSGVDNGYGYDAPVPWDSKSLRYDDVGIMSHVDLHSRIGGVNSGTLVATDKSDMKLRLGSRMSLAIGEKGAS